VTPQLLRRGDIVNEQIATLHRSLIVRRLGHTTAGLQNTLDAALRKAVGLA
jgi:mRNA-degrading endonuclease toxin of MazEF toxin-antitoxin module